MVQKFDPVNPSRGAKCKNQEECCNYNPNNPASMGNNYYCNSYNRCRWFSIFQLNLRCSPVTTWIHEFQNPKFQNFSKFSIVFDKKNQINRQDLFSSDWLIFLKTILLRISHLVCKKYHASYFLQTKWLILAVLTPHLIKCGVSTAKIYLYLCRPILVVSSKIAKANPHLAEWPEYTSVQSSGLWIDLESRAVVYGLI